MARHTFSIRRIMLCTASVAMPLAAFGRFEQSGLLVSFIIAVPLFIACLIASRDQLQSMLGILACTFAGICVSLLFPTVGRYEDFVAQSQLFGMIGCFVGLFWSEGLYASKRRARRSDGETGCRATNDLKTG